MQARMVEVAKLVASDRNAMYSLFNTHFEAVKLDVFDRDLEEKNWVILLEDKDANTLKGFSTLLMYEAELEGEVFSVVYSGDTIIDPSAWSSSVLPRAWIASVKQLRRQYSKGKLYWLLISSGYRTYRFLPLFWKQFYPRYDAVTPAETEKLIKFLACDRFGNCYDEAAGVVRFPHPQVLREGLRGIPDERMKDPHIRFFYEKNPGCEQGDELVCLTEIDEENLTSAGRRMWFSETFLLK